ncbi:AAA family ATPase [Halarcobacter anaerophilus]|uniref:AAA family ATPase n=1 Tax=Halarcobacter anaerophilus TaxID=877500 RepID=UPI0005C909FA|nr:AAA family ATPase [Halarcobacter anaerophilus]
MSRAAKYSFEGDEYQLQIALHWCIELLFNGSIDYMAIDVITIPTSSSNKHVEVDDIFIEYKDGSKIFIQAKKNETNHSKWSLNNFILKEEIKKAYQQYLDNGINSNHKIYFYSATPFGNFQKLVKDIQKDKQYSSYLTAPKNIKNILKSISKIISQSEEKTFNFLLSIKFGSTKTIEEWSNDNLNKLKFLVTDSKLAKSHLEHILRNHQIGEGDVSNKISKKYLEDELKKVKLVLTSQYDINETLKEFEQASKIGRNKNYSIKGHYLIQSEKENIINILKSKNGSVIVTDKPGGGKSCLLENIAKYFERELEYALLFFKGDEFNKVADDKEFYEKYNMPKDIIGKFVRVSAHKKVIVIIDSLDVIALNKDHGTLKFFLSIIDRIQGLDNVSLLIASRIFDLKYEPSLRERNWDTKIELKKFDFDNDIKPLLDKLEIPTNQINSSLKDLLTIPQNIKLFVEIYDKISYANILTEYDLFNSFVDEVIIKDELLGLEALELLGEMSFYCISNRTMNISNDRFQKKQKILQRLKSQEIVQIKSNMIKFSHQTLLDIFVIRTSINKNENFLDFITSTPQFPFIRPIVRSYFFILYSMDFRTFQKQILNILKSDQVTYHLKRLIVESFTELEANELNWKILQRIEKIDKYLFERFINVIKSYEWFEIIKIKYISNLLDDEEKLKWTRNLLFKSDKFINDYTKKFIDYYNKLINDSIDKELLFPIFLALTKLEDLKYDGIYNILKYTLKINPDDHFFAEVLSKYIDQTNKGDDLLWQFIIKDLNEDELKKYNIKLNCEDHNFCRDNFLEERFIKSEYLLTKAFEAVESWSSKMYGGFLDSSFSYEKRHRKSDMYGIGQASRLINIIEKAIIEHSRVKTKWWQNFEKKLLDSKELFFTYILIQIYEENILISIKGITSILTNKEIVDNGYLKDEILPLLNKSFPYLGDDIQLKIQRLLLNINDDKDEFDEYDLYYKEDTYEYLLYIPSYLRTKEVQEFIDRYKKEFGLIRKSPSITSWGGLVGSPITSDEMSSLSLKYILKLFDHYNKPIAGSDTVATLKST